MFSTKPICPRCEEPFPMSQPGAMSRMTEEREVEICSSCGVDEGLREVRGMAPIPFDEWPIDPFTRLKAEGPVVAMPVEQIRSRLDVADDR